MGNTSLFNRNEHLVAARQEIADREFNIQLKGTLVTLGLGAVALGTLFLFPAALGAATPFLGVVAAAGSGIAGFVTLKEKEKLRIDKEQLESYIQGKSYWGDGYREEVMNHGQASITAPTFHGAPPPMAGKNSPQRS